jgi:hypothetical protein
MSFHHVDTNNNTVEKLMEQLNFERKLTALSPKKRLVIFLVRTSKTVETSASSVPTILGSLVEILGGSLTSRYIKDGGRSYH